MHLHVSTSSSEGTSLPHSRNDWKVLLFNCWVADRARLQQGLWNQTGISCKCKSQCRHQLQVQPEWRCISIIWQHWTNSVRSLVTETYVPLKSPKMSQMLKILKTSILIQRLWMFMLWQKLASFARTRMNHMNVRHSREMLPLIDNDFLTFEDLDKACNYMGWSKKTPQAKIWSVLIMIWIFLLANCAGSLHFNHCNTIEHWCLQRRQGPDPQGAICHCANRSCLFPMCLWTESLESGEGLLHVHCWFVEGPNTAMLQRILLCSFN